jgi:hypothetical protein
MWFPNKSPQAELGYVVVEGTAVEADPKHSVVLVDQGIQLVSQSGSPIVSQKSGQVIGTLSPGGKAPRQTVLVLAPANGILKALAEANEFRLLNDAIVRSRP